MSFDTGLFFAFYNLSHHSLVLDTSGVFLAEYATYLWAGLLVLAVLVPHEYRRRERREVVVATAAAIFARVFVKGVIAFFYPRPRPFVTFHAVHPLVSIASSENFQSFPSGHTIFFFALATVFFCFNKRAGVLAFFGALLISVARVYVGVHWPSDILGGIVLGILTGWGTFFVYRKYQTRIDTCIARGFAFLHLP